MIRSNPHRANAEQETLRLAVFENLFQEDPDPLSFLQKKSDENKTTGHMCCRDPNALSGRSTEDPDMDPHRFGSP
jgi:hypothetical protein